MLLQCICIVTIFLGIDCGDNMSFNPYMNFDVATCQNPEAQYEISSGRYNNGTKRGFTMAKHSGAPLLNNQLLSIRNW